jgi:hypothetical protein
MPWRGKGIMKHMAWQFDIDASSTYFIRFHLCYIVGKAPHQLSMNAYIDGATVPQDHDLAADVGGPLAYPCKRTSCCQLCPGNSPCTSACG